MGSIIAVCVTILALTKRLPGARGKIGDKEFEIDDDLSGAKGKPSCSDLDSRDLWTPILVTKRRTEANNQAWARQKLHADEIEDDFSPMLDRRQVDTWQAEAACNRLHRVLYAAADQNHILEMVQGGQVDVDYLEDKVQSFRRRYDKLQARPGCTLPAFPVIADEVRSLLSSALIRFAEIATDEERKLLEFVESLKRRSDSPHISAAIDEAARRGFKEAV